MTDGAQVVPYGSWPSPLAPAVLAEASSTPGEIRVDADDIWWTESRPAEGGRIALVDLTRKVNDLLTIAKLLTIFETYETEAAAISSLSTNVK